IDADMDCSLVKKDEEPQGYLVLCSQYPIATLGYCVVQMPSSVVESPSSSQETQKEEQSFEEEQHVAKLQALWQIDRWQIDELKGRLHAYETATKK
ncbi:MAG: hypothetical protein V1754_09655, partial [Pseudomonadota bacterium]